MTGGARQIAGILLLLLCGVLPLAGCSQQFGEQFRESLFYRVVPKDKVDLAKGYVAALQGGKIGIVEDDLDPNYFDSDIETTLGKMTAIIPKEKPRSVRFTNANFLTSGNQNFYGIELEYEFSNTWIVANMVLETKAGSNKTWIAGVHVVPLPQSLEETNAFRLKGKSPLHYVVLALAIFMPLFMLVTAIVAGFSPIPRWKWLWIIFILFGFGQFNLNWTTGATGLVPLSFEVLGAMYKQDGFTGPIIISFGIPVGAILFWIRRNKWLREKSGDASTDVRPR